MSIFSPKETKHPSRLEAGARSVEEILIARRGPSGNWMPLRSTEPRRSGLLNGEVGDAFFEPLPDETLDAWEG